MEKPYNMDHISNMIFVSFKTQKIVKFLVPEQKQWRVEGQKKVFNKSDVFLILRSMLSLKCHRFIYKEIIVVQIPLYQ